MYFFNFSHCLVLFPAFIPNEGNKRNCLLSFVQIFAHAQLSVDLQLGKNISRLSYTIFDVSNLKVHFMPETISDLLVEN